MQNLIDRFDKYSNEYGNFSKIKDVPYQMPDVVAFVILGEIYKSSTRLIYGHAGNSIILTPDPLQLLNVSDDIFVALVRCGVRLEFYNSKAYLVI